MAFVEEMEYGGKVLRLETGDIARQASGSVIVSYGDTVVMCAVTHERNMSDAQGFATFATHFMIRSYAFGKIPHSFLKREGKPSEYEVLTSRLIDRSLRPLFPEGYHYETQLHCILMSYDKENDPDVPAIIGSMAAMRLAGIPLKDVVAATRVGIVDGKMIANPSKSELELSNLDILVSSTKHAMIMIESGAREVQKPAIVDACMFAHQNSQAAIDMINRFTDSAGSKGWTLPIHNEDEELAREIEKLFAFEVERIVSISAKRERQDAMDDLCNKVAAHFADDKKRAASYALKEFIRRKMRERVLSGKGRLDGRRSDEIRDINIKIGNLPRVHGSALFTRGNTQAWVAVTMGSAQDEQIIDSLAEDAKSSFMLHYNFPAFSVGETSNPRAPGRREVGHGKLAWKAVRTVLPNSSEFPYTIRVVSEITESDGSSSMATVCGASLALLDAGVPIKSAVAGVALGILKSSDNFVILTDILGDEDHLGEMDFKITGTRSGITALQMDVKNKGLMNELSDVIDCGLAAINKILDKMEACISTPREELRSSVPFIKSMRIDKNKVRDVIGAAGKMIREICETTGVKIDIESDGTLAIVAPNQVSAQNAMRIISDIVDGPKVGKIYSGVVSKVVSFGIFVRFCTNKQGLVHISVVQNMQKKGIPCEYKENDPIVVQVAGVEDFNKYRLVVVSEGEEPTDISEDNNDAETHEDIRPSVRQRVEHRAPVDSSVNHKVGNAIVDDADNEFDDFDDGVENLNLEDNDYNSRIKAADNYETRARRPSSRFPSSRPQRTRTDAPSSSPRRSNGSVSSSRAPAGVATTARRRPTAQGGPSNNTTPRRPKFF